MKTHVFSEPEVADFLREYYENRIDIAVLGDAKYEVVRCVECHFLWQKNVLNDRGITALYGDWISSDASKSKRADAAVNLLGAYAREVMSVARLVKKEPSDMAVLDFGMGWGRWSLMAKAFGFQSYGVELSEERCAYARSLGIETITEEEIGEDRFDFINSEQTFEHIKDPRGTAERLACGLKRGGVLRIAVPDADKSLAHFTSKNWKARKDAFHPLEHINSFTHETLGFLGKTVGLTPIHRPLFPMVVDGWSSLVRSFIAPVFYGHRGTIMHFRKS